MWNITEAEYHEAARRQMDPMNSDRDAQAYYQLCRCFRGQSFLRNEAAYALDLIRSQKEKAQ